MKIPFSYGFARMSDPVLDATAASIVASMKEHPAYFPPPHPELTAAEAAQEAYSMALAQAKGGSLVDKAVKNQKRSELINTLLALGSYATIQAAGDPVIQAACNFPLRKSPVTAPPLGETEIKQVQQSVNSGSVEVVVNKTTSARWYRLEYTQNAADPNWPGLNSTRTRMQLTGLESGKQYAFRVIAYGINNQVSVSNVVQLTVF
jgi:hypothetical protein